MTVRRVTVFLEDKFYKSDDEGVSDNVFYIIPEEEAKRIIDNSETSCEKDDTNHKRFIDNEDTEGKVISVSEESQGVPQPLELPRNVQLNRYTGVTKPQTRFTFMGVEKTSVEPKTIQDALNCSEGALWRKAEEEYQSLIENGTCKACDLPPEKIAIFNKWCFKIKRDSEGNVERHKTRLVIKGFSQRKGIDYEETFSPVIRYSSIRLLLAMAAKPDLGTNQMDVVTPLL